MVIEESKTQLNNTPSIQCNIGNIAKKVLQMANDEERVITGLSAAVKSLSDSPNDALFCFIAPPQKGDSATHMLEVLLQAFCFENDIYIIKVDNSEKLSRIVGSSSIVSCALIQRTFNLKTQTEIFSEIEDSLVDHCEAYWDSPKQPIISLPES